MPRPVLVYAALAALAAGALTGCTGDSSDPSPAAPSTAVPTPLSAFDTGGVAVARVDLCDLVPDRAVDTALAATGWALSSYGEGDRVTVAPGVRDRSGELACTWRGDDGTTARAWVFAAPVTRARARGLAARVPRGCRSVEAPAYGDPSVATVCHAADGPRTAAYAGLFVDAWLSCSLTGTATAADLRERAGTWCVAVAQAAAL